MARPSCSSGTERHEVQPERSAPSLSWYSGSERTSAICTGARSRMERPLAELRLTGIGNAARIAASPRADVPR